MLVGAFDLEEGFLLGFVTAQALVELGQSVPKGRDILWIGRLQLLTIGFINVGYFPGLDPFQEMDQPISLFMPVLTSHRDLRWSAVPTFARVFQHPR
jgi:hypothetical protein